MENKNDGTLEALRERERERVYFGMVIAWN